MFVKCIVHVHITAELKAYWLLVYVIIYMAQLCKEDCMTYVDMMTQSDLALQRNISNCLLLIPHRQLGSFSG